MANTLLGLAAPVRMTSRGYPEKASDERLIAQGIHKVLKTGIGERVRRPLFGSVLHRLLFANMGPAAASRAQVETRRAVELWIQRVQVDLVIVRTVGSRILVEVVWRVRGTLSDATRTQVSFDVGN